MICINWRKNEVELVYQKNILTVKPNLNGNVIKAIYGWQLQIIFNEVTGVRIVQDLKKEKIYLRS